MSKVMNKSWLGLMGISLASFLGCIDFTIVNTALPSIQISLNASMTQLQWVVTLFMLVLSASMVVMGRLADLFGRRKLLYIGMVVFALSSLGAGLSPTIEILIVCRFIQGLAVAILYTVPVAIVTDLFPKELRGKAMGILIGANGFGLAVGPVVGGVLVSTLSWHWIFLVNLPLIVLSFAFCLPHLNESKSEERNAKIDGWGVLLLMLTLPMLVYATVEGANLGWLSWQTLGLYGCALLGLTVFYSVEKRSVSPTIDFNQFANKPFLFGIIANFSLAFFYTVAFFLIPLYLHNILGYSIAEVGFVLLPATLMVAILSPWVGRFVDKHGPNMAIMLGFILFGISALIQIFFTPSTSLITILVAFMLFGIGWAFILTPSIVAVVGSVEERYSGVVMGALGTLHNFGGAIGLAIGTVVYHAQAKAALLKGLPVSQQVAAWVDKAIAVPDEAVSLLTKHLSLGGAQSIELFQQFFTQGYSGAMVLLGMVSLIAFGLTLWGMCSK